eukprot:CAMPEP_0201244294 /NCGR_PEP_ID=MMETSP0852-20130820/44322_1 /ASSEMBLY_ACC=CAM_ASM_000632 /TAXON_ID=183588 /ORGANISM="Pseudo-nitzschia fraudulenta, Strain WWA7" /LENGTH=61 /DNA_ID=CAMNT_0047541689 /DNA_START=235 /DNA_END=417 /DNA_ORIENTATION=+
MATREHAVVILKQPTHAEGFLCCPIDATYRLNQASKEKPKKSKQSAIEAEQSLPPRDSAYS